MVGKAVSPEMGAAAFMTDFFREMISIVFLYFYGRKAAYGGNRHFRRSGNGLRPALYQRKLPRRIHQIRRPQRLYPDPCRTVFSVRRHCHAELTLLFFQKTFRQPFPLPKTQKSSETEHHYEKTGKLLPTPASLAYPLLCYSKLK